MCLKQRVRIRISETSKVAYINWKLCTKLGVTSYRMRKVTCLQILIVFSIGGGTANVSNWIYILLRTLGRLKYIQLKPSASDTEMAIEKLKYK